MSIEKEWATPRDFATLFQYLWYRDFPIDQSAIGAHRADWTIHIGIVVRNIADLMGFVARFERGGRKDAVLRSESGDEIALEWEWNNKLENEIEKLREHKVNNKSSSLLRYAVLITYSEDPQNTIELVLKKWKTGRWPLLLILITELKVPREIMTSGRQFQSIKMALFSPNDKKKDDVREAPALPWKVTDTRWSIEHIRKWENNISEE